MKDFEHDILKDPSLKECPFTTPEGYFDDLKKRAVRYSQSVQRPVHQSRKIIMTLVSIAATLAIMLSAGTFFLAHDSQEETYSQEDFLVFSCNITDELLYDIYAETDIEDDDIIESYIDILEL